MPFDVRRPPQREIDGPDADDLVGESVDQTERTGAIVAGIGVECRRPVESELAIAKFVHPQCLCGKLIMGVHVDPVAQIGDLRCGIRCREADVIGAPGNHRFGVHPDHVGRELVGNDRQFAAIGLCKHIAAIDVQRGRKADGDRVASGRRFPVAPGTGDPGDVAFAPGQGRGDLVADADLARGYSAGKAATVALLDRHPERPVGCTVRDVDTLQQLEQTGAVEPDEHAACLVDVLAGFRRQRNDMNRLERKALCEIAVLGLDRPEPGFVPIHQVHLVHRKHDIADAQKRDDMGMVPRPGQDALRRVDQDDRQIGTGRARCHRARVLCVARHVSRNEAALFRLQPAKRQANRAVERIIGPEQREVHRPR